MSAGKAIAILCFLLVASIVACNRASPATPTVPATTPTAAAKTQADKDLQRNKILKLTKDFTMAILLYLPDSDYQWPYALYQVEPYLNDQSPESLAYLAKAKYRRPHEKKLPEVPLDREIIRLEVPGQGYCVGLADGTAHFIPQPSPLKQKSAAPITPKGSSEPQRFRRS